MTNAPPPPSSAAQSARTILTRLHEVMASRANAQGKLNQVVGIIGAIISWPIIFVLDLIGRILPKSKGSQKRGRAVGGLLRGLGLALMLFLVLFPACP